MTSILGWTVVLCLVGSIAAQAVITIYPKEKDCTTEKKEPGICVYQYQCEDGVFSEHGENTLDVRQLWDECGSYMERCCKKPAPNTTESSANEPTDRTEPLATSTAAPTEVKTTTKPPATLEDDVPPYETVGCGRRNPDGVIFRVKNNQNDESEYGEWPWVAAIFIRSEPHGNTLTYLCGGALIHQSAILTSAKCLHRHRFSVERLVVRLGEWDMSTDREPLPHVDATVEKVHLHRQYGQTNLVNDIAIVVLNHSVELSHTVDVVCLPTADDVHPNATMLGVGWGEAPITVAPTKQSQTILKRTNLTLLSHDACAASLARRMNHSFKLHPSFLCGQAQRNAMLPCKGDSGSPFVTEIDHNRFALVGLSSWGYDCNLQTAPTVLTNVAFHRDWIDGVIKEENMSKYSYIYEGPLTEDEE